MKCPECGYVLEPFEKVCPRCPQIRIAREEREKSIDEVIGGTGCDADCAERVLDRLGGDAQAAIRYIKRERERLRKREGRHQVANAREEHRQSLMTLCPVCTREVSRQARTCPGCGHVLQRRSGLIGWGYAFAIASFICIPCVTGPAGIVFGVLAVIDGDQGGIGVIVLSVLGLALGALAYSCMLQGIANAPAY